jgi:chromosome segregation ATPase
MQLTADKMAGRQVKTQEPGPQQHSEDDDLGYLISDLEGTIKVNRELVHHILKDHTASARNGPATASRIPSGIAQAMIRENAMMERRLQRLEHENEEQRTKLLETSQQIKELLRNETDDSSLRQQKSKQLATLQLSLTLKDKQIEQLKRTSTQMQREIESFKSVRLASVGDARSLIMAKQTHVEEFKRKLSIKLRYFQHRRSLVTAAYSELNRLHPEIAQVSGAAYELGGPLEDLGYGQC